MPNETEKIKNKLSAKEAELYNLKQYGRRKNLEFYGIPGPTKQKCK